MEEHCRIDDLVMRRDANVEALKELSAVCTGKRGPGPDGATMELCKRLADESIARKKALGALEVAAMTRSEATEAEDNEPLHDATMTSLIRLMSSGDDVALLQFEDVEYWLGIANGTGLHLSGQGNWHTGHSGKAEVPTAELAAAAAERVCRGGRPRWAIQ